MPGIVVGDALQQQLRLFEQQAAGLGSGGSTRDLASVVGLGLATFEQLRHLEIDTAGFLPSSNADRVKEGREIADYYAQWYRSAKDVRHLLKMRAHGDLA